MFIVDRNILFGHLCTLKSKNLKNEKTFKNL